MDVIVRSADFDGMALKVLQFGRPFRAISLCLSFPGMKPWAVFCSPVGRLEFAQENVRTPGPEGPRQVRQALIEPYRLVRGRQQASRLTLLRPSTKHSELYGVT